MNKSPYEINKLTVSYSDSNSKFPDKVLIPHEHFIALLMEHEGWTREVAEFYADNLPE